MAPCVAPVVCVALLWGPVVALRGLPGGCCSLLSPDSTPHRTVICAAASVPLLLVLPPVLGLPIHAWTAGVRTPCCCSCCNCGDAVLA